MPKTQSHARTRKRRVVIIDDDPDFGELMTTLVGGLGHDAVVKADSSASHTYEIRDSDIVFVDLMMPKVSGVQVLEQLARQNVKSAIVLMSGNDKSLHEAEQVVKNLDLDLLGVLHKPFQLPDVQSVLEAACHAVAASPVSPWSAFEPSTILSPTERAFGWHIR